MISGMSDGRWYAEIATVRQLQHASTRWLASKPNTTFACTLQVVKRRNDDNRFTTREHPRHHAKGYEREPRQALRHVWPQTQGVDCCSPWSPGRLEHPPVAVLSALLLGVTEGSGRMRARSVGPGTGTLVRLRAVALIWRRTRRGPSGEP